MRFKFFLIIVLLFFVFGCAKGGSNTNELLKNTFEYIKQNDLPGFKKIYFNADDVDFFCKKFKNSYEFQSAEEFDKQNILEGFKKQQENQEYLVKTIFDSILEQAKVFNINWTNTKFLRSEVGKKVADKGMPLGLIILDKAWLVFADGDKHYSILFEGIMKTNRGFVVTGSTAKLTKD